jgi:hypothetical protein
MVYGHPECHGSDKAAELDLAVGSRGILVWAAGIAAGAVV